MRRQSWELKEDWGKHVGFVDMSESLSGSR